MRAIVISLAVIVMAGLAFAQPNGPPRADPALHYVVEGNVLLANGHAAAGVVVERTTDPDGKSPRGGAGDRLLTDAQGHFRFLWNGLGWPDGGTWHLAVTRDGCPGAVVEVTLHEGPVPPSGSPGLVATGVLVTLPRCSRDH